MSNYIEEIAGRIHQIADADQRVRDWWGGDGSSPDLLRAYAGLVLVKGEETTLADVHDMWAAVTAGTRPDHRYLVPMGQVPVDVQAYDQPYVDAIRVVSREERAREVA